MVRRGLCTSDTDHPPACLPLGVDLHRCIVPLGNGISHWHGTDFPASSTGLWNGTGPSIRGISLPRLRSTARHKLLWPHPGPWKGTRPDQNRTSAPRHDSSSPCGRPRPPRLPQCQPGSRASGRRSGHIGTCQACQCPSRITPPLLPQRSNPQHRWHRARCSEQNPILQ